MKLIKALLIDDDLDAIQQIKKFGEENAVIISVCGYSNTLQESIEFIKEAKPELIFFNPSIENLAHFNLLKELDFNIPKFIFISKDEKDAFQAFKHNAIDFLKKPLDFNDLIVSLYKVIKNIEMEISFQDQKLNQINSINSTNQNNGFLAISSTDKIELIKVDDIVFCRADGKYTEFVLSNGTKILSSKNLGEYNNVLTYNYFFRIHHSYVINIKHISKITKKDGLYCEFTNGVALPIAKRRQEEFIKFIKL